MSMSQPYHHPLMAAASSWVSNTFQNPDVSIGGSECACAPGTTVPPDPSVTSGTADIVTVQMQPMGNLGDSQAMGWFQFTKVGGWWFSLCRHKLTASVSKPLPGLHFIKKGNNTHNIGAPSQSGGPSPSPSCQSAVIWDTADVGSAPYNIHNHGASSQSEGSLPSPSHQPAVIQDTVGIGSAPESSMSSFLQHSQSVAHSWI